MYNREYYFRGGYMNIIDINKMTYRYNEDFIFYNLDLIINKNSWVTICGPNKSGKSTLIKILSGLIKTDNDIKIDSIVLNDYNVEKIRKVIGVVFDNLDNGFICDTVREELEVILHNFKLNNIKERIKEISELLNITSILDRDPHSLSGGEKNKALLACALVHSPKILMLDDAFNMIDNNTRKELLQLLNSYKKNRGLTIINVTHDLSESFYSDRLIVINDGCIVLDGKPEVVMKHDTLLYKIGVDLPFIVDLSNKLISYELINKIYFDMEEMVDDIWK